VASTSSSVGTVDYTVANPTTYITAFSSPYDWHYSSGDNTLWQSGKTIYDPCPAGYRVPDGGGSGVWSIAHGSSSSYIGTFDSINRGFDFSGDFGEDATIWYPCAGYRTYNDGSWSVIGHYGHYWSVSPNDYGAYRLRFDYDGNVGPSFNTYRADGNSVRCLKEGTGGGPQYDNDISISGAISLSDAGTANSYIVSSTGTYSIPAVKGNSSESVGSVASAEVLWETFGTDENVIKGNLISGAQYENGQIYFKTADSYREGNAVIAAKDASGTILWSWHIWLTDQPQGQIYNNNAGTMMDRNLGATSATAGDVGALGLLYQWGRKDPFLGSSSISSKVETQSTITWPSPVSTDFSNGTIEYAISHPTTFIKYNTINYDWYYTGFSSTDDTRWQSEKTIYDPCPAGWRVPDGGDNGVWATAKGSSSSYTRSYDSTNEGMNFSGDFGLASTIWYPASGYRGSSDGALYNVGRNGYCWSVTPDNIFSACNLSFNYNGYVFPALFDNRAQGQSVRCLQEGTGGGTGGGTDGGTDGGTKYDNDFSTSGARNLSDEGTANSYILSSAGSYSISPVKGNSSEPVGSVASAEVLWETFGTDENIIKGNLISGARYENGRIYFKTADAYREGNAVIAAKDANGTILWSWHIWLTDQPEGHVYNNNAGTMMDRNLGATSATAGDVGALGLLYQWGRKDPFLGSSSVSSDVEARSTITWPSAVSSDSSTGTVDFVTSHPTTFVKAGSLSSNDWHYSSRDNTLWQSEKTIYDPCPVGWRVPDGGDEGVWSAAKGSSSSYNRSYDSTNKGMNFSGDFGSASTIWYPASGYRDDNDGALLTVGSRGFYWSVTPGSDDAYALCFSNSGIVSPTYHNYRAYAFSVRCLQESE
jgi:uncharacterized protein (TIGR02145 family)